MSTTAIALISASVVLHALWNLLAKGQPTAAFFFLGNLIGTLLLVPILISQVDTLPELPPELWWLLGATGIAQAVYCASLAAGYRTGDLSLVYPLVRCLAPVFVVAVSIALGRGDAVGMACVVGIVAILVGSGLLGASTLRAQPHEPIAGAALGFSLLAAIGSAGYTLADDAGVHTLLETLGRLSRVAAPAPATSPDLAFRAGIFYASLEGWAVTLALGIWIALRPSHRTGLRQLGSLTVLRNATLMGAGSYAAYILVLISMSHVSDISYVAGFRQLSVPLGAAIGVIWLGESLDTIKGAGLTAILIGLLLIAVGR